MPVLGNRQQVSQVPEVHRVSGPVLTVIVHVTSRASASRRPDTERLVGRAGLGLVALGSSSAAPGAPNRALSDTALRVLTDAGRHPLPCVRWRGTFPLWPATPSVAARSLNGSAHPVPNHREGAPDISGLADLRSHSPAPGLNPAQLGLARAQPARAGRPVPGAGSPVAPAAPAPAAGTAVSSGALSRLLASAVLHALPGP